VALPVRQLACLFGMRQLRCC